MIEFSHKKNMLMECEYHYTLQDVKEPVLYRDMFSYGEVPKCTFNQRLTPLNPPDDIWITDTTFRDGQQSRAPYTVEQIVTLYKMMSKLRPAARSAVSLPAATPTRRRWTAAAAPGLRHPEITGWIRAKKEDFLLAKEMGMQECGILVSCSDYHIFKKLKLTRAQAMDKYLGIVKDALAAGIHPRCHLGGHHLADFYGFVVLATQLSALMHESGCPIKLRACDTMGYGVCYPGASMPRSVPGIIYGLNVYGGFPSELIEWHGHNDFYKAVSNSASAWLYGASAVNCSLLGIGERTGNTPLEAMVFEYAPGAGHPGRHGHHGDP